MSGRSKSGRLADRPSWAKRFYLNIGFHTAEQSTLLFRIHLAARYPRQMLRTLLRRRDASSLKQRRPNADDPLIAFRLAGGIGDQLLAARYVRDLLQACGDFRFDVYSTKPGAAAWIFAGFPQFNRGYIALHGDKELARHYPLFFRLATFVKPYTEMADMPRVAHANRQMALVCERIESFKPDIKFISDNHPKLDGHLVQMAAMLGLKRTTFLQGMSGIDYGGNLFPLQSDAAAIRKFGLESGSYVTIHNGFDDEQGAKVGVGRSATKCYPRYAELIALLKQRMPSTIIVQIGVSTSIPIPGADLNLINRTSLPEVTEIIRRSSLHIDGESGLVHIAASLGTTSCVIFGPTPADYFAYDGNINIRPRYCGNCYWMTPTWSVSCPRGFDVPRCLSLQEPTAIADAVCGWLALGEASP
jgi:ADP-heptose:LPS heptosyltransferase